jgi:hypothetical protein
MGTQDGPSDDRNPRTFYYTPSSGQAVTGLHPSPPREAGPLTHNIMFHKNSFLLEGNKIITLNLYFFGDADCFCDTVSQFLLMRFRITEVPLYKIIRLVDYNIMKIYAKFGRRVNYNIK